KSAIFVTESDAYENNSDVPELAEVKALLVGPEKNMVQALKEAAALQPRKEKEAPQQPAKNLPVPAKENKPTINKEFMSVVSGTPKELVIKLGDQLYARKYGRWYALHDALQKSGKHIRSSKIE